MASALQAATTACPASQECIDKAEAMIKDLSLGDSFTSTQLPNPALQQHYAVLHALALGEQAEPSQLGLRDDTDAAKWDNRIGSIWRGQHVESVQALKVRFLRTIADVVSNPSQMDREVLPLPPLRFLPPPPTLPLSISFNIKILSERMLVGFRMLCMALADFRLGLQSRRPQAASERSATAPTCPPPLSPRWFSALRFQQPPRSHVLVTSSLSRLLSALFQQPKATRQKGRCAMNFVPMAV